MGGSDAVGPLQAAQGWLYRGRVVPIWCAEWCQAAEISEDFEKITRCPVHEAASGDDNMTISLLVNTDRKRRSLPNHVLQQFKIVPQMQRRRLARTKSKPRSTAKADGKTMLAPQSYQGLCWSWSRRWKTHHLLCWYTNATTFHQQRQLCFFGDHDINYRYPIIFWIPNPVLIWIPNVIVVPGHGP